MNIFQNMFRTKVSPTLEVKKAFQAQFNNPVNVEWSKRGSDYEAIFYLGTMECIALYDALGGTISVKRNVTLDDVPDTIATCAKGEGEVMSIVCIDQKQNRIYEVIVRDAQLIRSVVYISNEGIVLDNRLL